MLPRISFTLWLPLLAYKWERSTMYKFLRAAFIDFENYECILFILRSDPPSEFKVFVDARISSRKKSEYQLKIISKPATNFETLDCTVSKLHETRWASFGIPKDS